MSLIPVAAHWQNLDFTPVAKNWTQDDDGTQVRQGNSAQVMRRLAHALNHMLCRQPKRIFGQAWQFNEVANTESEDPLCRWQYYDKTPGGVDYTVHVVFMPRDSGAGNCYAQQWGSADFYAAENRTAYYNKTVNARNQWGDVQYASFRVNRGATGFDKIEDGLSTFNDFVILSVLVQEDWIQTIDTDDHLYVNPNLARKGGKVLADLGESIRSELHKLRTGNLPVVMDHHTAGVSSSSDGGKCIVIDSTTYVNIYDQSETTRTAGSSGSWIDVYAAGYGLDTTIDCICRVLATPSDADAYVQFIGPSDDTTITITGGGALDWYGGTDTDIIALDPSVDGADLTTSANKVDVHAKITAAATDLKIYGVYAEVYHA
ncbi:MAG: hypothetical protein GY835_23900 [bacterium]|nr:hypothetical protein [bacterium]